MPKLMLFVPCQHVAFDAIDSSPSLLGLFQGFTVNTVQISDTVASAVAAAFEIPVNTGIPIRWAAFALWRRVPEDEGKRFVQICELIKPNGESSTKQSLNFQMTQNFQRNTIHIQNFPIDQEGDYLLKLFLVEEDSSPTLITEYPLTVTYKAETPTQA
jgi:hypothetical protein